MARQIQTDMSFAFCEGSGPVCVVKTMADSDQRSPNKTKQTKQHKETAGMLVTVHIDVPFLENSTLLHRSGA